MRLCQKLKKLQNSFCISAILSCAAFSNVWEELNFRHRSSLKKALKSDRSHGYSLISKVKKVDKVERYITKRGGSGDHIPGGIICQWRSSVNILSI